MNIASKLLWLDCTAGATVGLVVSLFHGWFSELYALPAEFVLFMGLANFAYGVFSFSLAIRPTRPRHLFILLVSANITWGLLCLAWLVVFRETASIFGMAHLALEAAFVAGLGLIEWRNKSALNIAAPSTSSNGA